jgi:hypothetical protein
MTYRPMLVAVIAAVLTGCAPSRPPLGAEAMQIVSRTESEVAGALHEVAGLEHRHLRWVEDTELFDAAAASAWAYAEAHYYPATGLIRPVATYPFGTIWDIGSMLAALYGARELGYLDDATYDGRLRRALATLQRVPLYDDAVFNKAYDTRSGTMIDRGRGPSGQGAGWSTTDLGRLLIWLKIVGTDARYRTAAETIVRRNDFTRIVRGGYLWGEDVSAGGQPRTYQEGRIGYEQYAAHGFALWDVRAEHALNLRKNALPMSVMGQRLVADIRQDDRLTNEPFLLLGLEIGWDADTALLVRRLMQAQESRYRKTGRITVAGEDAIDVAPHFFYYYSVFGNGRHFVIDVQDRGAVVDGPRWISAKSAFAWHALLPSRYSTLAVAAVQPAKSRDAWASGVDEASGESTLTWNINTAAVILSAALVHRVGEPLLAHAQRRAE